MGGGGRNIHTHIIVVWYMHREFPKMVGLLRFKKTLHKKYKFYKNNPPMDQDEEGPL